MAIGVDYGTMFLVAARKDEESKTKIIAERNCFLKIGSEFEDMLESSNFQYVKESENKEDCLFVCGNDSLRLANLLQTNDQSGERKSALRRPMQSMVINSKTDKKSIQMLKYLSQSIVGDPKEDGEVAVISIPANPLDKSTNNVYHQRMCVSFIESLGYEVHPINEALAVAYASNPTTIDENGEELNMTGVALSFGAGGVNGALVYKGLDTIKFSLPISGDWIDREVSEVAGLTVSEVTAAKEKLSMEGKLDLSSPDLEDELLGSLYIYYENLINNVARSFKKEFVEKGITFPAPISVVVSGGTSKPKGFEKLVKKRIEKAGWPFEIKDVVRTKDPLSATAIGCLNAAISKEKKNAKPKSESKETE